MGKDGGKFADSSLQPDMTASQVAVMLIPLPVELSAECLPRSERRVSRDMKWDLPVVFTVQTDFLPPQKTACFTEQLLL